MLKIKILLGSAISIVVCSLIACTNLNKHNKFPTLEEECQTARNISKQCEILNKEDFTLDDKKVALGFLYLFGSNTAIVDYDKAYYWFEKSAIVKNKEALDGLGMIYFAGLGRDKDFQKAEEYFLEANKYGSKDAKLNLVELYRVKDFGRSPDFENAERWYLLGVQDNPSRAYEGLSKMYLDQENYEKAFSFSKKAAELGNPEAQYNLGVFFEQGVYVKKDKKQAIYWYKKAIENREPRAAYNLASLYEKGDGVEQDFNLAYAYYTLASELGLEVAQSKLFELDGKVAKENIRILKNGENIQIAVDDPSTKWEIMDEEDYLKKQN